MKNLIIYLDSRCDKSGVGCYAFAAQYHNHVDYSGGEFNGATTMSAELFGALQVLEYAVSRFMPGRTFHVVIDSSYVFKGITQWLSNWEANGWKSSDNKEIKNVEIWQRFYFLMRHFNITWTLVTSKHENTMFQHVNRISSDILATALEYYNQPVLDEVMKVDTADAVAVGE
jgi:ribonuclease HI